MTLPSLASESRTPLPILETETSTRLAQPPGLEQRLARRAGAIMKPLAAELGVFRERPALAVVALMPLSAFLFVGLFLGELIGALLGIYFVGINLIFLRNKTPSSRTPPSANGPCLDLIPETSCRRLSP